LITLDFVKRCGVNIQGNTNAQQMHLYFGTRIYSDLKTNGIIPLRSQLPPYLAIGSEFETEWMSSDDIREVKQAWRRESLDGGKRVIS